MYLQKMDPCIVCRRQRPSVANHATTDLQTPDEVAASAVDVEASHSTQFPLLLLSSRKSAALKKKAYCRPRCMARGPWGRAFPQPASAPHSMYVAHISWLCNARLRLYRFPPLSLRKARACAAPGERRERERAPGQIAGYVTAEGERTARSIGRIRSLEKNIFLVNEPKTSQAVQKRNHPKKALKLPYSFICAKTDACNFS